MDNIEIVKWLGLQEKEAKVYIACLEIGSKWASAIARKVWENRITTYDILKKLCKKWIASEIIQDKKHIFSVISPKILLEKQKTEQNKKLNKFKEILPYLTNLQMWVKWIKPIVQLYDWLEWIKSIYEDSINSSYQDVIIWKQEMDEKFEKYLYNYFVPERIKRWMKVRIIHWKPFESSIINNVWKRYLREVVEINEDLFNIWNVIFLHSNDKVSIIMFSSHEMSWLTIQSKILHDTFQSIFNLIWKQNKKIPKKDFLL